MVHFFSHSVESSYDELFGMLHELVENQRKIMGDFTALNAAFASLASAVAANTAAVATVTTLVGALKIAPDQSQIDSATALVVEATGQVMTNNTGLGALSPPVTPPSS